MSKSQRYRIELSKEQLTLISHCVEDLSRFMAGQMELFNTTSMLDDSNELQERLNELQPIVTPELHYGWSYGWSGGDCPNERQRKFIAQTYYIYREILHVLAIDDNQQNVYSSETLRCKDSGEPIKITKI